MWICCVLDARLRCLFFYVLEIVDEYFYLVEEILIGAEGCEGAA